MIALVVGIIVVTSLLVGLWVLSKRTYVPTDDVTLCPTDRPPSEVMVLLLDMSDEFSEPQRLKIDNSLKTLEDGVGPFGLVEIYAIDRVGQRVVRPVVERCSPGRGDDVNQLYQNPAFAKQRWEEFSRRLTDELARLMSQPAAPTSPIMEAVQATALRTFNRPNYRGLRKRLVIVSDLLQNVPGRMNQHTSVPTFDVFSKTPYFAEVRGDLSDVHVTLLYLVRTQSPQPWPAHRAFWEQYFQTQAAVVERIEPVFGGR